MFENKDLYHLNCEIIADLLNKQNGNNYGESTYRKEYKAFNRGRMYERSLNDNGVSVRILSISDLHCPFNLPIETYRDYVGLVDILQINGDVVDHQALSKFPKAYRMSTMEEIIMGRQYLIDVILYIKPKKVVVNYGNHDLRFESYLAKNLDSDLIELMPRTSLELIFTDGIRHYDKRNRTKTWYEPLKNVFTDIEIEYVDNWYVQIGDVMFCHPLAFKSGMMATARQAMYFFRNDGFTFKKLVMAHTHRTGDYAIGDTIIYEQGACCDTTKLNYSNGRLTDAQKMGFIYICQDKDGNTITDKTKLIRLN